MKKTYMSPKAFEIKISTRGMLTGSNKNPAGFNGAFDNNDNNAITPDQMLSRRRQDVWDDEEEEDW